MHGLFTSRLPPQTTWTATAGGHPLPLAGPATGPTAPSVPSAITPARTPWVSRPTTAPSAAVISPRSHSAAHPDCPLDVFERSDQGPRATQEDSIAVKTLHGQVVLLGLFDGHAGAKASEYCKTHTLELAASVRMPLGMLCGRPRLTSWSWPGSKIFKTAPRPCLRASPTGIFTSPT
eukprot:RCo024957